MILPAISAIDRYCALMATIVSELHTKCFSATQLAKIVAEQPATAISAVVAALFAAIYNSIHHLYLSISKTVVTIC